MSIRASGLLAATLSGSLRKIRRRHFLKYPIAFGCGCLVPQLVLASSPNHPLTPQPTVKDPLADQTMLRKAFQDFNEGAFQYMSQMYNIEVARSISNDAEKQFETLLSSIPDLGSSRNIVINDFPFALWYVAYLRPMKAQGKTAEELGKMIYELFETELCKMSEATRLSEGAQLFTAEYIKKLQEWATWTQKREYPDNWVATFVPGDGSDFDYGYDYSECAIVKYLKAHGAEEVAPYICLNDFIRSRAYGTGLRRTKTIAQGDGICNFRYKKGRLVTQDWDTEIAIIRSRMKPSI